MAHELRPAVADLLLAEGQLTINIRLNLEAQIARIGPEHQDSDDSPNAQTYSRLRSLPPEALRPRLIEFLPTLYDSISLTTDAEKSISVEFMSVQIPEVEDTRNARDSVLLLAATLPPGTVSLKWQWHEQNGPIIVRAGAADAPDAFAQFLAAGSQSDAILLAGNAPRSVLVEITDYMRIGFLHIVPKGLDHILFVVGLFLTAPRLKPVLWQVSSFTVAHTITLALGITGIVSLPATLVEPLIALSIVVVGIENVFTGRLTSARPLVVFVFGLLHGLGFASVLGDVGLNSDSFLTALLAFNVGVELGQLTVILLCFTAVGWLFRNKPWYRQRITIPGSLLIAATGLFWFVQRVF
ncbi:MAG: HupE/UreJ family protein, partial [Methylococcales bacterium]|nr:HupE/UreJ family protein [Methylococcales bacterium]